MAQVGRIRIAAAVVSTAIGLEPNDTIAGASFDPSTGELILLVFGDGMPEAPLVQTPRGQMPNPADVTMTITPGDPQPMTVKPLKVTYTIAGVTSAPWTAAQAIVAS